MKTNYYIFTAAITKLLISASYSSRVLIMNKKKLWALVPSYLIAMLSGSNVCASTGHSDFYVGFDVLKTSFSTKAGYGRNVFAKNPTAFNAFVGYKLPRNFFVEAGYEWTGKKNKTARLEEGDYYPGALDAYQAGDEDTFHSKIKIESPYAGIGFNYFFLHSNNTYLSVLAGLSNTKIKGEFNLLANQWGPLDADLMAAEHRTFNKRKLAAMLRLSINHNISDALGISLTGTWHRLTNLKINSTEPQAVIKLKNACAVGVGVFYSF